MDANEINSDNSDDISLDMSDGSSTFDETEEIDVELGVRPYQFEPETDSDEEFVHQAPEPNEDERLENTNWLRQWLEIE
jgi:hypothetical protein